VAALESWRSAQNIWDIKHLDGGFHAQQALADTFDDHPVTARHPTVTTT
jgi:hypothetical protein